MLSLECGSYCSSCIDQRPALCCCVRTNLVQHSLTLLRQFAGRVPNVPYRVALLFHNIAPTTVEHENLDGVASPHQQLSHAADVV